jgi:penicillin-insensitive murein DD-endopeptidase
MVTKLHVLLSMNKTIIFALVSFLLSTPVLAESVCYGTISEGRLENGEKMPLFTSNLHPYSYIGWTTGRTYVHAKVKEILLETYQQLESSKPDKVFVYGETAWKHGGQLAPHKTHQNGLSVDLMVPVVEASTGHSVRLPTTPFHKFGYGVEFDLAGKYEDIFKRYQIDFETLGELMYTIHQVALKHKVKIGRMIFDKQYKPLLYATSKGKYIKNNINIPDKNPWIRHDEHFHVDFEIPCRPL